LPSRVRPEILEHIACQRLSKSMVEEIFEKHGHTTKTNRFITFHRPEILAAFEFLEAEGLIKELNTDPGPGLIYGRGRPKTYYAITKNGLRTVMDRDDLTASKFWKILFGYVTNNEDSLTIDEIEAFYQMFMKSYLTYHNHIFYSQLHEFHYMCMQFEKTIFQSDTITTAQKVIEVLSIKPKITFEKLVIETGGSESDVRQVLTMYSSNKPDKCSEREYAGPLIHNIVIITENDAGKETHELSLFGLMLSLTILRYHHFGILKHGLYFKDYSLEQYHDKIASIYKEKLPLIFRKWDELKKVLAIHAAYNFGIVLDKGFNTRSTSLKFGGTRELCEGIRTIISYNTKQMWDFAVAATEAMLAPSNQKTFMLYAKFEEVMRLLCPASSIFNHTTPNNPNTHNDIGIFRKKEEAFAEEISALYYMNLSNSRERVRRSKRTLQDCLSVILENDPSLRKWFSRWIQDLETLQNETLQHIKTKAKLLGTEHIAIGDHNRYYTS
jgi:DNA-binding PadR family transcriptional regulator